MNKLQQTDYSETSFWEKVEAVAKLAKKIAKEILSKALVLYYTLGDPEVIQIPLPGQREW